MIILKIILSHGILGLKNTLAKIAETVDEISNGRLVLGLGAGWAEPEYRSFGYPYDHRFSRFEEAFTIIRTLIREGAIDFAGDWKSSNVFSGRRPYRL